MAGRRRPRRRYLVFKIIAPANFKPSREAVEKALSESLHSLLGMAGAASTILRLEQYDEERRAGIIASDNRSLERARAAVAAVTSIDGVPCIIHIVKVTGTLRRARELASSYDHPALRALERLL